MQPPLDHGVVLEAPTRADPLHVAQIAARQRAIAASTNLRSFLGALETELEFPASLTQTHAIIHLHMQLAQVERAITQVNSLAQQRQAAENLAAAAAGS